MGLKDTAAAQKDKQKYINNLSGATEAVPPRGAYAPLHDLAGDFLPPLKIQGDHPSIHLQVPASFYH